MIKLASVDESQVYRTFMKAFADYAMDASGTKEDPFRLRMAKNNVDFDASAGAYIEDASHDDGDRLVGFTLIGIDEVDGILTAFDAGTGIIPDFRGQGLAKRMFDHALPALAERGVKRFLLEVLQGNEPAIKAYQKSGFSIDREFKCFAADTALLRELPQSTGVDIRISDAASFEALTIEADWTPSFENRFTAHLAIPEKITFLEASIDNERVGTLTYCSELNWLLSLLVKRSARNRGVGRSLLQHLASSMPETVTKLAALNVDGKDEGMQSFLATVGFSPLVDQYEMSRSL